VSRIPDILPFCCAADRSTAVSMHGTLIPEVLFALSWHSHGSLMVLFFQTADAYSFQHPSGRCHFSATRSPSTRWEPWHVGNPHATPHSSRAPHPFPILIPGATHSLFLRHSLFKQRRYTWRFILCKKLLWPFWGFVVMFFFLKKLGFLFFWVYGFFFGGHILLCCCVLGLLHLWGLWL